MKKFVLAGVLGFFLVVLTFSLSGAEGKVLFQDEFNSFDRNEWGPFGDPKGKWTAEEGLLVMEGRDARITSPKKFRYATLEVRMCILAQDIGTYYYLAFMNREPEKSGIMLMSDDGISFRLLVEKKGGELAQIPSPSGRFSVKFLKGKWHTWKIAWSPSLIEVFIDGESCARYDDKTNIPDTFLPVIIDSTHTKGGQVKMMVDWVKVIGEEVEVVGTGIGRQERNAQP